MIKKEVNAMNQYKVDSILIEDKYRKVSAKNGTTYYQVHENIEDGIDEIYFYEIDKFIFDCSCKEWCECAFGNELENIYVV